MAQCLCLGAQCNYEVFLSSILEQGLNVFAATLLGSGRDDQQGVLPKQLWGLGRRRQKRWRVAPVAAALSEGCLRP